MAVSTPAWCVPTQDCQDIAGVAFVAPTSVCFQLVSTREVGFTWGDLLNGLIGMAFDATAALICGALTGNSGPPPSTWRAALAKTGEKTNCLWRGRDQRRNGSPSALRGMVATALTHLTRAMALPGSERLQLARCRKVVP